MRERPILMSAPMVREILSGRKTQTRRVVKGTIDPEWWSPRRPGVWEAYRADEGEVIDVPCPHGVPGDRLWVRECWLEFDRDHWREPSSPRDLLCEYGGSVPPSRNAIAYRADTDAEGDEIRLAYGYRWRPSIFMPRWASRLTLDLATVRIERAQEISEEDVAAEGIDKLSVIQLMRNGKLTRYGLQRAGCGDLWDRKPDIEDWTPRECWRAAWCRINGPESWAANPWVWALTFRKLEEARS